MARIRAGRKMRLGPYGKAWAFLAPGVVCLVAGFVLNTLVSPSKLSKPSLLELGGLVILLWIIGALLVVAAVARFRRAAAEDRRERSRATAHRLASEQLAEAGQLGAQLLAGEIPAVDQVWDVVLRPDERALLDRRMAYSRFYGTRTPLPNAAARTTAKTGRRTRAQEVAWALGPRWRDQQQARVVVTDQRLLCQVDTHGWLSFEHKVATAIKALPEGPGVVLEYPGTSPLSLSGPGATQVMVVVVWALYGAGGLREHPALAEVRASAPALPPGATRTESDLAPASGRAPAASAQVGQTVSDPVPVQARDSPARVASGDPSDELLAFLAASEFVFPQHVAELLQITIEEAVRRLDTLRRQGAASRAKLSPRSPAAYRITATAADDLDPALPQLRPPNLRRFRHDTAAAWLWVTARQGRFGQQRAILSRREMQAADAASRTATLLSTGARFADNAAAGSNGDVDLPYRDLALVQPTGDWHSIDVVLSRPNPEKLRTMISQARRDQTLAKQLFVVNGTPRIRTSIETVAGELGLADRVVIQPLASAAIAIG